MKTLTIFLLGWLATLPAFAREDTPPPDVAASTASPYIRQLVQLIKQGRPQAPCSKGSMAYRLKDFVLDADRVNYVVDPRNMGRKSLRLKAEKAMEAVHQAAEAWRAKEPQAPEFIGKRAQRPIRTAFAVDGRNTISWQNLAFFSTTARVAVSLVVDTQNKKLVEFDIALDASVPWTVETGTASKTGAAKGAYDVQNAMTNALGQILGLGEVVREEDCGLAMYPFILPGETQKRVPGTGDVFGIRYIYSNKR